jgi:hypothetical protein
VEEIRLLQCELDLLMETDQAESNAAGETSVM